MSRYWISLACVAMLATVGWGDEPKSKTQLGKGIRIPANIGMATNVSEDGQAAGMIFDNAYVSTRSVVSGAAGATNQTETTTKVITVNVPYTTDQRSVTMLLDVRGYVNADAGATVRLVACAGDQTKVIELGGEQKKEVKLKGKSKASLATAKAGPLTGDYESRVAFTVQTSAAAPVCQITLFLSAEHDTDKADQGGSLLVVDSLDLQIGKSSKAAYNQR